jgi:uncharacterized membrane protein
MMTNADKPVEVRRYLQRLDDALVGVPSDTAADIRAGIAEELTTLDARGARERIDELGDPAFIAAEAREHVSEEPVESSALRSRAYVIVTVLAIALGGAVVPVVGWVAGIVLMWFSPAWRRWEKWAATLAPLIVGLITAVTISLLTSAGTGGPTTSPNELIGVPVIPAPMLMWNALVVVGAVNLGIGVWLLVRGLSRLTTMASATPSR